MISSRVSVSVDVMMVSAISMAWWQQSMDVEEMENRIIFHLKGISLRVSCHTVFRVPR